MVKLGSLCDWVGEGNLGFFAIRENGEETACVEYEGMLNDIILNKFLFYLKAQ